MSYGRNKLLVEISKKHAHYLPSKIKRNNKIIKPFGLTVVSMYILESVSAVGGPVAAFYPTE